MLAFTIDFQGGGPHYAPDVYDRFDNNGFTPDGALKPAYADRVARILARADELGIVAIVSLFYGAHLRRLRDEAALWRAADEALAFLAGTGRRNLLIEAANEVEVCLRLSGHDLFRPARAHEMVDRLRAAHPGFLYSTSQVGANAETGKGLPPPALVEAVDFVTLHGNGTRAPQLAAAIEAVLALPAYRRRPKPLIINEDSTGIPNMDTAWRHGVSWGYYDQGFGGPGGWGGNPHLDYRTRPREDRYDDLSGF